MPGGWTRRARSVSLPPPPSPPSWPTPCSNYWLVTLFLHCGTGLVGQRITLLNRAATSSPRLLADSMTDCLSSGNFLPSWPTSLYWFARLLCTCRWLVDRVGHYHGEVCRCRCITRYSGCSASSARPPPSARTPGIWSRSACSLSR